MSPTLILFMKEPVAGAVKTRLARGSGGDGVGFARAARLHRIFTDSAIAQVHAGARLGLWRPMAAISGPAGGVFERTLKARQWGVVRQTRGDLGARMAAAMRAAPKGPVVIIGADAPGLRVAHLRRATDRLRGCDGVFGPADDGGYWLIGLSRMRRAPDLFKGVRWSTKYALEDTIASLPGTFRTRLVDPLTDIDTPRDLKRAGPRVYLRSGTLGC